MFIQRISFFEEIKNVNNDNIDIGVESETDYI